jgi:hypothetical protein
MVQSRVVSMRSAFVLLGMLFTAACGGPLTEEADTSVAPEPAVSQEVAPPDAQDVSALEYTCGETNGTCPTGDKCCYPCGIDGCLWQCQQVARCPLIP